MVAGTRPDRATALMKHYQVPGLNTIRQAQQLLVEDGLDETRQGVGAFVLRTEPAPRPVDVLAELRAARAASTARSARWRRPRPSDDGDPERHPTALGPGRADPSPRPPRS